MMPTDFKQIPALKDPLSGNMHGITQSLPHHQQHSQHSESIRVALCLPHVLVLRVHVEHVHLGNTTMGGVRLPFAP